MGTYSAHLSDYPSGCEATDLSVLEAHFGPSELPLRGRFSITVCMFSFKSSNAFMKQTGTLTKEPIPASRPLLLVTAFVFLGHESHSPASSLTE